MTLGQAILRAGCNFTHNDDTREHGQWRRCITVLRKYPGQYLSIEKIAEETRLSVSRVPRLMNAFNGVDHAVSARGEDNRFYWRAL